MLTYASDLLQNALDLRWSTAKGSYKVLMTEMEASELFWDDHAGVRQQYAQRNVRPAFNATGNSRPLPNVQRKICMAFQTGTCPSETDHKQGNVYLRHICAYCFSNFNRPFPHREQECRKKGGRHPRLRSGGRDSIARGASTQILLTLNLTLASPRTV